MLTPPVPVALAVAVAAAREVVVVVVVVDGVTQPIGGVVTIAGVTVKPEVRHGGATRTVG